MPFLQQSGASVHYLVEGAGDPLVLIAGIASDQASWAPIVPLLADRYRLIMIDNRGCGQTEHSGPINPDDWSGDIIALLDHLEIAKTDIVGHSLGGMIGLRVATTAPERVGKMVLSATTAGPEPKSAALLQELMRLYESDLPPQDWFRLLFQWLFAPPFFADPATVTEAGRLAASYEFCQAPSDFRRQVEAAGNLSPVDPGAIDIATLLLLADQDVMVPPATSRQSFDGMPNLREQLIAEAGHSLHWDQPQAFADAVKDFCR